MMDIKKSSTMAAAANTVSGGPGCITDQSSPLPPPTASTSPFHPFLINQFLANSAAAAAAAAGSTTITSSSSSSSTTAAAASSSSSSSTASSSSAVDTTAVAQQLLQNYAMAATSAVTNFNDNGSNSSSLVTLSPSISNGNCNNPSFWDPSTFGSTANGLMMAANDSQQSALAPPVTLPSSINDHSFTTAASQLLATISAQMVKESSKGADTSSLGNGNSGKQPATSTEADSNKNKLFCLMCGQTSNDPMEYEQHLISHFSLLDPGNNQKIYQYGMHFLQMQNLLNNTTGTQQSTNSSAAPLNSGPKNVSQDSQSTAHASSLSGTATQIMNKKRKLLASNNHDSGSINSEPQPNTNRNDHDGDQDVGSTKLSSNQSNGSGLAASSSATFPCTSCHKTFATEVDLKAHLIRHLTQHPFVCFSCGKGFKYEHSLNFHVKSYHSGNSNSNSNSGGSKNSSEKSLSKSRTSSNSSSNINDKTISDSITTPNTDSHLDQSTTVANNLPLKLKRKSSNSTSSANHLEEKKSKQQPASSMIGLSDSTTTKSHLNEPLLKSPSSSGTLMAPTLITDENHNQTTARSLNWSNPDLTYFYGKPPTNLPPDSPIQIRSEKILISILDAVNVATEQSMLFYKCCLCCVAFPNMDQMNVHMQNVHHLVLNQDFSAMLLSPSSAGSAGDPNHQSSKQQHNVAAMAAMQALLAGKSGTPVTIVDDPKLSSPNNNSSSSATSTGTFALYQCDKCLAKFKESIEYEIHCQLHRTLEMASNLQPSSLPGGSGSSATGSANNQYQQFQFLNSLMMGGAAAAAAAAAAASSSSTKTVNQSKIVDFRKVLTNCSKNTDFGSKFAAHLMDGSANPSHHHHYSGNVPGVNNKDGKDKTNLLLAGQSGDNNFPPSVHDRCSPPSMLPSIISTPHATPNVSLHLNDLGGKVAGKPSDSDPNNNSLLYLSGIVPSEVAMSSGSGSSGQHHHNHHHPPSTTTKSKSTKSIPKDLLNLNDSITKSSSHQQKSTGATKPNMSNAGGKMKNSVGSGSSSSSSSASGSSTVSTRYIIEPVDIFEGAGQSLPIQKFAMGDIEETAPGQFKCRFCDKTFDRVFSVHRHERVHTGFKPCVCKTCGRGFSEKRNLRHHIIRFHSDGSGRELLKRKRKPKNGSIGFEHHHGSSSSSIMDHQQQQHHQQQQLSETTMMMMQQQSSSPLLNMNSSPSSDSLSSSFMSSLLSSAAGSLLAGAFPFKNQNQNNDQSASANTAGDGGASLSNLKLSLAEMNRIKMNNSRKVNRNHKNESEENDDDDDGDGPGEDENDEDGNDSSLGKRIPTSSSSSTANSGQAINLTNQLFNSSVASSSRRRKSKPSKKIATSQEDDQDDNDAVEEQEENNVDIDNDEKLDKKVTTGTKNRAKSNKNTDSDQDVHSMIVLELNQQQESEIIKSKIAVKNQESDGDETEAEEDERLEGDNDKGNNSDTEPEPDSKLHQRDDFDDEEEEEEGETEKNTRNNKSKKSARSNKNTAKSSRSKPHRRNSRRRSTTS